MPRDYYEILGVERDANKAEVKRAFRRLARELHPDVNAHDPEAEEKFKAAAEAYEVLSDPERRRAYDAYGHEGLRGSRLPAGRRLRLGRGHLPGLLRRRLRLRGAARADARPGPHPHGRDLGGRGDAGGEDQDPEPRGREREIELPPGTQHGTQFALRGHGMPGANGGPPGDLVIAVQVIVPSELSEEQRELAEKLGETLEPRNLRSGQR